MQSLILLLLLPLRLCFLLLLLIVLLLLQLLLPLHDMLVVGCFFFLDKADVSSTDIAPFVSGRSPQTLRICSGAHVATCVSTEQE